MNTYWWCPSCNHGWEYNHRKCITGDFGFNGMAWEAACLAAGKVRAKKHLIELSEHSDYWLKKSHVYSVLPPGSYFIGDVRSAISSDLQDILYEGAYVKGKQVYVAGVTKYRRPAFLGSNKIQYPNESGFIGIMSVNMCDKDMSGSYHTFIDCIEVRMEDHILQVRSGVFDLKIDTRILDTHG